MSYCAVFKAIHQRKMFGFIITHEPIVGHIIMLGTRSVLKHIQFLHKVLNLKIAKHEK